MGSARTEFYEEHDKDIRKVLEILKKDEFVIGKLQLFVPEVEFVATFWWLLDEQPQGN